MKDDNVMCAINYAFLNISVLKLRQPKCLLITASFTFAQTAPLAQYLHNNALTMYAHLNVFLSYILVPAFILSGMAHCKEREGSD